MTIEDIFEPELLEQLRTLSPSGRVLVNVQFRTPEGLVTSDEIRKVSPEQLAHNLRIKGEYSEYIRGDLNMIGILLDLQQQSLFGVGILTRDEAYKLAERPYVQALSGDKTSTQAAKTPIQYSRGRDNYAGYEPGNLFG